MLPPGGVHDIRIFRDSYISVAFEDGMLIQIYTYGKYVKDNNSNIKTSYNVNIWKRTDMGQWHEDITKSPNVIHKKKHGLSPLHDVYIITLLAFFIEMLQYDWLWSGHMIIKEMFHISMKLKSELARATMTTSDVNNQWSSNFQQQII